MGVHAGFFAAVGADYTGESHVDVVYLAVVFTGVKGKQQPDVPAVLIIIGSAADDAVMTGTGGKKKGGGEKNESGFHVESV